VERWCLELTAISSKINAIAFHKKNGLNWFLHRSSFEDVF
jgi:hypothetical protein